MKDEWGNVICPKCKQRNYKILSVSCVEGKPGFLKFKALCHCKKKFSYDRPITEIGVYYKPDKPEKPVVPKKSEVVVKPKKRGGARRKKVR